VALPLSPIAVDQLEVELRPIKGSATFVVREFRAAIVEDVGQRFSASFQLL